MSEPLSASGFLKTTSLIMMARVGGTGLGFLIQLALVRLMTPTDYGVYVIALSLAGVLSIFCALGFPSVSARFVAAYLEVVDLSRIAGFIRSAMRHILTMTILLCVCAFGVLFASNLIDSLYQLPLLIACLMAPVLAMMRFGGALSNTARRFYLTYLPDVSLRPMLLLAGLLSVYFTATPMTSSAVLFVHLAAAMLACCALWVVLRPGQQFGLQGVRPLAESGQWRRAAAPMMFVTLLTSFLADIDVLLLSALLPAEEVGIFSVCLRIMLLIEFGVQTVFQMSMPDIATARAREDVTALKTAMRRGQQIPFVATLVAFLGVFFFGEWFLLIFGERFVLGHQALVLLVASQVARSLFGPVTQLLTVAGAQMRSLVSYGIALLCLVVGNSLLVPTMGVDGGATAFALSMVIGALLQAHAVYQKTGLSVVETLFLNPARQ